MSDSVLVAARGGAAVGCHCCPDPDYGAPGVEVVLYVPEQDRGCLVRLNPEAAVKLGRALVAAAERVQNPYNAWILKERDIDRPLPSLPFEEPMP